MKKKLSIFVVFAVIISLFSALVAFGSSAFVNGIRTQYEWNIPMVNKYNPSIVFDGVVDLDNEWYGALCVPLDLSKDSDTYEEITLWPPAVWTNGGYDFASYDEMDDAFKITINTYYLWDANGLYIASVCDDMVAYNGVYDVSAYMKGRDYSYGYSETEYSYDGMFGHSWEPMIYYSESDDNITGYHWPYFFIGCGTEIDAWMDYDVTSNGDWANTAFTAEKGNPDTDHAIAQKIRSVGTIVEPDDSGYGSWAQEIFLPWEYLNAGIDENGALYQKADLGDVGDKFRIGSIYGIRNADTETGSNSGIRVHMSQTKGWGNPDFYTLSGYPAKQVASHVDGNKPQYDYAIPKVNPWNPAIVFDGTVDLEKEWAGATCVSIDMSEDSTTFDEITLWPQGVWNGDFKIGSYEELDPMWRMTINTYFLWDDNGLYIATKCDDCSVFKGLYNAEEYINYLAGRSDSYSGDYGFHFEPMIVASADKDAYVSDEGGHWPNFFIGTTNPGEACWKDNEVALDSVTASSDELSSKIKHAQILNAGSSFSQEIFLPWEYINSDLVDGTIETVGNVGTAGTTFRAGLIYSVRSSDEIQTRLKYSNAKGWANYDSYTLSAQSVDPIALPEESEFVDETSKEVVHSVVESGSTEQPNIEETFLTEEEQTAISDATESGSEVQVVIAVTAEELDLNSDDEEIAAKEESIKADLSSNLGENISSAAIIDVNITKTVITTTDGETDSQETSVVNTAKPVTVTVKVPEGVDANNIVAVVNTDNDNAICPFTIIYIDGQAYISFETSHFSAFAFVQKNHSFDETKWGYQDKDGHAHLCTIEGHVDHSDIIPHTDEDSNDYCDVCGYFLGCSHYIVKVEAVKATCQNAGNIEYWKCNKCQTMFDAQGAEITDITAPKKDHEWISVYGKTPTCTENGWRKYYKCLNCNLYAEDSEGSITFSDLKAWKVGDGSLSAKGHDYSKMILTNAYLIDYTEDYLLSYWYACSHCNASAANDIDAADKVYTEQGYIVYGTIKNFGDSDIEITLKNSNDETVALGMEQNGLYALLAPVGDYTLNVSCDGHTTRVYAVSISDENVDQTELNVEIRLKGDVNGDGKVNILDVNLANLYRYGKVALSDYEFACANVDSDEDLDINDIQAICDHYKNIKKLW